ncbi:hypothetical protein V8F06_014002 [Rhypophila decipiens]
MYINVPHSKNRVLSSNVDPKTTSTSKKLLPHTGKSLLPHTHTHIINTKPQSKSNNATPTKKHRTIPHQRQPILAQHAPRTLLSSQPGEPKCCTCGWYHFYSTCGHLGGFKQWVCGETWNGTVAVFCRRPAPVHVVHEVLVVEPCQACAGLRR